MSKIKDHIEEEKNRFDDSEYGLPAVAELASAEAAKIDAHPCRCRNASGADCPNTYAESDGLRSLAYRVCAECYEHTDVDDDAARCSSPSHRSSAD